jgi:hypothetical protein
MMRWLGTKNIRNTYKILAVKADLAAVRIILQEVLGRTNRLLSFDTTRPAQTHRQADSDLISLLTKKKREGGYTGRQECDLISLKISGDTQTKGQTQTDTQTAKLSHKPPNLEGLHRQMDIHRQTAKLSHKPKN